jgi:hypothetical protein
MDSRPRRDVRRSAAAPPGRRRCCRPVACAWPTPCRCPDGAAGFARAQFVALHGPTFTLHRRAARWAWSANRARASPRWRWPRWACCRSGGQLEIHGQAWPGTRRRPTRPCGARMQVVFQDPFSSLSPRMTVEEIVGEGLHVHHALQNCRSPRARAAGAAGAGRCGTDGGSFPHLLERYPHEFSGGQRQRAGHGAGADRRSLSCWCWTNPPARWTSPSSSRCCAAAAPAARARVELPADHARRRRDPRHGPRRAGDEGRRRCRVRAAACRCLMRPATSLHAARWLGRLQPGSDKFSPLPPSMRVRGTAV